MKKLISAICALSLCAALLAGCNGDTSGSAPSSSSEPAVSASEPADAGSDTADSESTGSESGSSSEDADTAKLDEIVSAIEAVNPVENPFAIDDPADEGFYLQYTMNVNPDNLVAYRGDVTNNQTDCALVFAAQVKDGTAETVVDELKAFQSTMTTSLYAEFADKVAKAQDARIVSSGNIVVMVIAGVNGPDYADIDAAIESALA